MAGKPKPLSRLSTELSKLPGIGPKSANRLAFHMLTRGREKSRRIADALVAALGALSECRECFGIAEGEACQVCADPERDRTKLCVVEDAADLFVLEEAGVFTGVYHVLGGSISPLEGTGPDDLRLRELRARLEKVQPDEVILALNADPEGEATATWILRELGDLNLPIHRLGGGLPYGGRLEYSDRTTLEWALRGRRE